MNEQEPVSIDRESLRTLNSLVHSIEVSLGGVDKRIARELEVIEVSRTLADRARELLDCLLKRSEGEPPRPFTG
jgi:hypothetical protein